MGLLLPLKAWAFDKVPLQGPVPVTVMDRLVLSPLHIVAAPLIDPVGLALTVTPDEAALSHSPVFFAVAVTTSPDANAPTVADHALPLTVVDVSNVPLM